MWVWWVLTTATLLGCVTLTLLFYRKLVRCYPSTVIAWKTGLVSTIVSVLLGVTVALAMIRVESTLENNDARARLETTLSTTLSVTKHHLSDLGHSETSLAEGALILDINPIIVSEALRSGLFDAGESRALADLEGEMRAYRLIALQYPTIASLRAGGPHIERVIEERRIRVLRTIDSVGHVLNLPDLM